ncbi:MAG: peptide/nickel transport system ATP-binding protein [Chloroflexota bacterium]|jgi:peptide/nickel transport system ATP-binding protein|nr:peptide/nickel transport system ATP-binding protein [Chloroflexota bacterium]
MSEPAIVIADVVKSFDQIGLFGRKIGPRAIDGVSLTVQRGETLGIVGESGSGKSTLLRLVLRLIRPTSGSVRVEGRDVWAARGSDLRAIRREMQAVFQDPASSFNPRQTIGAILAAPLEVHGFGSRQSRRALVGEMLERVGLPAAMATRYPHQLSGGQKQRVAIARAIILKPAIVLADEPTSALDVSVQAQILDLFEEIKRGLALTSIFVSHNLAVIRHVSDHVAVMRRGRIVEVGPAAQIFANPQNDYTRALIAAVPDPYAKFGNPRNLGVPL